MPPNVNLAPNPFDPSIHYPNHQNLRPIPPLPVASLLLHLQPIHDRRQLAQDLVGLLVELELRGDEIGQVAEGLRGVEDLGGERKRA